MPTLLARLIRARRRARGFSVEDLAARIGVETSTIRRWERDGVPPSARHVPALRQALGIPLALLDEAFLDALSKDPKPLRIEGAEHLTRTGKDWLALARELIALDIRALRVTDMRDEGSPEQWAPILEALPAFWRALTHGDAVVGYWHLLPLSDEALARMREGALREGEIGWDDLEFPAFPGLYNGYLSALAADPPYRFGRPFQMLMDSMLDGIADLAAGGVFFCEITTPGYTLEGRKLCERLGFARIGIYGGLAEAPLYAIPARTLAARPEFARHEYLRQLYEGE